MKALLLAALVPMALLSVGCNEQPKPLPPVAAPSGEQPKVDPNAKGPIPDTPANTRQKPLSL